MRWRLAACNHGSSIGLGQGLGFSVRTETLVSLDPFIQLPCVALFGCSLCFQLRFFLVSFVSTASLAISRFSLQLQGVN